jgi:hypothetical protein
MAQLQTLVSWDAALAGEGSALHQSKLLYSSGASLSQNADEHCGTRRCRGRFEVHLVCDLPVRQGICTPNGKHWVDRIRKKGNEATHEIFLMGEIDAKELLSFLEMLLRFIYEFPNLVPQSGASPEAGAKP